MKVLLVQTGFLGDVILSTPVISGLRLIFPKAEISFLTTPQARPLVENHPELHEVLVYEKRGADAGWGGLIRKARELRKRQYPLAVSLHKSYRTAALLALAGIPRRIGFREAALSWTYTKTVARSRLPHDVLRNLVILESLGARMDDLPKSMRVYPGEAAEREADDLLRFASGTPLVGIAPGSVWATKRWTEEGYRDLLKLFVESGYGAVLLGGTEDRELTERIAAGLGDSVLNLAGRTSLAVSAAVIARLSLLVTNDSSPLHLASAAGTPVVAVFCATVPEFGYGPWRVPHEIVQYDGLSCRPCGRHGGNTCPTGTHACQIGVTVGAVHAAAERILASAKLQVKSA